MKKAPFIVIEGPDGSGKTAQQGLLLQKLRREGCSVASVDFPQYETSFFGRLVGRFLAGEFGSLKDVDPRVASVLYAADRWEASGRIRDHLSNGVIVVGNRYTLSNEAHQAARLPEELRPQFIQDIRRMEYEVFGIPMPDVYLHLDVPVEISQRLILEKAKREYLKGKSKDLLEEDAQHQIEAARMYQVLAKDNPNIRSISCVDSEGNLMKIEAIHELVWNETKRHLTENIEGKIRRERG